MATSKFKHNINLLPQNEFESTTLGRVLTWILSTFRIIVIVTEMVVMLAFLSRFWLDAKNSDLEDILRQKQSVIAASKAFENEFRLTQKKLTIFSALASANSPMTEAVESIVKALPPEVVIKNVTLVDDQLRITGGSLSETAIAQFIVNLEDQESFENVELVQADASADDENLINFGLAMKYKQL